MNKAMFKPKNMRYWEYQYELIHEHELTYQQGAVYAYLYNHCINKNDVGYCGYSDEQMAKDLRMAFRTFQRELKTLKDKRLIIVKNPQKRTKKAGESRMIYINPDNYLTHQQLELTDVENNNLKCEVDRLKKQNEELLQQLEFKKQSVNISNLGLKLVKAGFMSGDEYMRDVEFYNSLLQKFFEDTDYEWVLKSFSYFTDKKANNISDYSAYLASCIKSSVTHYRYQNSEQLHLRI